MDKGTKIVKRKKFNFKKFLILLLILYIIGCIIYYLFQLPIKSVLVEGNKYVSETEVIKLAKLTKNPSIIKMNLKQIKKNCLKHPLIKDVEIERNLNGRVVITINENKILFYNKNNDTFVLSNNDTAKDLDYLGIPTLLNYVPSEIYEHFIKGFDVIETDVIMQINEIEYAPSYNDNSEIVDPNRFLMRMNDGNTVYISVVNLKKMNYYIDMVSNVKNKGILYLDTAGTNFVFEDYSK